MLSKIYTCVYNKIKSKYELIFLRNIVFYEIPIILYQDQSYSNYSKTIMALTKQNLFEIVYRNTKLVWKL